MKAYKVFLALILSLVTLLGMFSVSYASSASMAVTDIYGTEVSGSVSTSANIYVKGKLTPGEIVMISVLNPMDESNVLSDSTMSTHLYWADDTIAASDGSYSFLLDFSNCHTGDYTIRIASADSGFFKAEVLFVIDEGDRDAAIAAINSARSPDEVKSLFINSDAARNLSLNTMAYKRLGETAANDVYKAIFDYKNKEALTVDNLDSFNSNVFFVASALALYNQENTSAIIEEFSTAFDLFHNENTKKTYDLIPSAEQRNAALNAICSSDYQTVADMQKAYGISVCLYAVKNAPWQSFDSIISSNSYLFGESLSISEYQSLQSKSGVALKLSGVLYDTSADFIKAFNEAVLQQLSEEQKVVDSDPSTPSKNNGGGRTVGVGALGSSGTELEPFYDDGFGDLSQTEWARTPIEYLQEKGIVSGVAPNTFAPQNTVKREEFIKMLVLILGKHDANAKCSFADVPLESWSSSYIASAVNAGLVQGISENYFGFESEISRQDACVLLYRALSDKIKGGTPKEFADQDEIAAYAKEAVEVMSRMGLVNGMADGNFKPNNVMTRAEAAKLLYELCLVIGG